MHADRRARARGDDQPDDDPLVELARRLGLRWYRGSEHDVLARYLVAAPDARATLIVRVTSDDPLIDPRETDLVVAALEARRRGARGTARAVRLRREQPRFRPTARDGLRGPVVRRAGANRADGHLPPAREHVTWFCRVERPDLFALHSVRRPFNAGDLRWTVDTPEDLALVRRIYTELELAKRELSVHQIIGHVRDHPELAQINAHITQKAAGARSIG